MIMVAQISSCMCICYYAIGVVGMYEPIKLRFLLEVNVTSNPLRGDFLRGLDGIASSKADGSFLRSL